MYWRVRAKVLPEPAEAFCICNTCGGCVFGFQHKSTNKLPSGQKIPGLSSSGGGLKSDGCHPDGIPIWDWHPDGIRLCGQL